MAEMVGVRTGRHDCYDRTVFEFDGPVNGYTIGYATEVLTDGEGADLVPYTAGEAFLAVSLQAPARTIGRSGQHMAVVTGYPTLRDVLFGGSYEGYSTFAVGVRARLPFRVLVLPGPGSHSRVVLDVAHRWEQ